MITCTLNLAYVMYCIGYFPERHIDTLLILHSEVSKRKAEPQFPQKLANPYDPYNHHGYADGDSLALPSEHEVNLGMEQSISC